MTHQLSVGGIVVAGYEDGGRLDRLDAPRPYLHPVSTLGGVVVTDFRPDDHPHHLGVSLAVPDVNGTTFWGGRTYVADRGSVMLDNHGSQVSQAIQADSTSVRERLIWLSRNQTPVLEEHRQILARGRPGSPWWTCSWTSVLTSRNGPLTIASPAVNGRPGAGYGGLFWRFPRAEVSLVLSESGTGAERAHGSGSPWLAVSASHQHGSSTVILRQPGERLPWFVRDEEYVGAGPALAWDTAWVVEADQTLTCRLDAVVVNGWVDDPDQVADLIQRVDDPFALRRFVDAQEAGGSYARAVDELRQGRKSSHWMWFVFPQIAGLGRSATAQRYAIGSRAEARAYLEHEVLGPRLVSCATLLASGPGRSAPAVFGEVDAVKLRSSMTLFARAAPDQPIFARVLDRYFEGRADPATDQRLDQPDRPGPPP